MRVIVADDAVLLREGIRQLLRAGGCEVVAAVGSVDGLRTVLSSGIAYDALVLDIRMPPTHTDEGVRLLEQLRAEGSHVPTLLLSMYASAALVMRAMSCGAGTGYLLKERVTDGDTLVAAIRTLVGGGSVVDPEVVALLIGASTRNTRLERLTDREREILTMMAEGRSNFGIAKIAHLSQKTVESHVSHILEKLGLESSPDEHRRVLAVLELMRSTSVT